MPERAIEEFRITEEPYYLPVDGEVDLFAAAHSARLLAASYLRVKKLYGTTAR
jgi:hypothetical protein